MAAGYVYDPSFLNYRFSRDHPLNPARLELTYMLCRHLGLLDEARIIPARETTEEELLLWHTKGYLEAVRHIDQFGSHPRAQDYGFDYRDNVPFKGIFAAASLRTGGTMAAVDALQSAQCDLVFAPSGGFHHAMSDRASGFCVFNDLVLAIKRLLQGGLRIAYVDIDAHHADGVQAAFYQSRDVLFISIHQSGETLFPGTGFPRECGQGPGLGYTLNLPLAPGSGDDIYAEAIAKAAHSVRAYSPDLLVAQLGCDAHRDDPLANLNLSTHGYRHLVQVLTQLARETRTGKLLATGGGGYNMGVVPRCWALAFATMIGKEVREVPADLTREAERFGVRIETLHDDAPTTSRDRQWNYFRMRLRELEEALPR